MVKEKGISVVDVSVQSEKRIQDDSSGEIYTLEEAISEMWNEIREIRRAVG
jgi:hypothetical protein